MFKDLTRLSTQLLFATTKIEAILPGGRPSSGTAFFYQFLLPEGQTFDVLITNWHVVQGATTGRFLLHLAETPSGGERRPSATSAPITLTDFASSWVQHPAGRDLCAMPIGPLINDAYAKGRSFFYINLVPNLIPTQDMLDQLAALENVVMVGYPIGLSDETNNLPILRRGITASHPAMDFGGRAQGVVDIGAFPGSSGSPIFVLDEGAYASAGEYNIGSRALFLGVLWGTPTHTRDGRIEVVDVPTAQVPMARTQIPTHLGYYLKAREIEALRAAVLDRYDPGWRQRPASSAPASGGAGTTAENR